MYMCMCHISYPQGKNQLRLLLCFSQGANSANHSREFAWLQHKNTNGCKLELLKHIPRVPVLSKLSSMCIICIHMHGHVPKVGVINRQGEYKRQIYSQLHEAKFVYV